MYCYKKNFLKRKNIFFQKNVFISEDQLFVSLIFLNLPKIVFFKQLIYVYVNHLNILSKSKVSKFSKVYLNYIDVLNKYSEYKKNFNTNIFQKKFIHSRIKETLYELVKLSFLFKQNFSKKISKNKKFKLENDLKKKYFLNYIKEKRKLIEAKLINKFKKYDSYNIYIYSAGINGVLIYNLLKKNSFNVRGFIDDDKNLIKNNSKLKFFNFLDIKKNFKKNEKNLILISNQNQCVIKNIKKIIFIKLKKTNVISYKI